MRDIHHPGSAMTSSKAECGANATKCLMPVCSGMRLSRDRRYLVPGHDMQKQVEGIEALR